MPQYFRLKVGRYCLLPESSGVLPYFTYTRLNLFLDPLSVIGFQHLIALIRKTLSKWSRLHNFCKDSCTAAFTGNVHIFIIPRVFKILRIYICWVKGLSKMYNLLKFAWFWFCSFWLKISILQQIFKFANLRALKRKKTGGSLGRPPE